MDLIPYLFIDRDGTLVLEPKDYQLDHFQKLLFYPEAIYQLAHLVRNSPFRLVMVTNQDGLGTPRFPEDHFQPVHDLIIHAFEANGVVFEEVCIDRSYPHENLPTRKPGTGMLTQYFSKPVDWAHSFVIGDRLTDVALAKNLGCKAIWINNVPELGADESDHPYHALQDTIALTSTHWSEIATFLIHSFK